MPRRIDIKHRGTEKVESHVVDKKTSTLAAKGGPSVKVFAKRADITAMQREGDDLILGLKDGSVTRLEGYFDCVNQASSELAIVEPGGGEWKAMLEDVACLSGGASAASGLSGGASAASEALAYSFEPVAGSSGLAAASAGSAAGGGGGMGAAPWIGLGALAAGAAAAAGGGGGGGGSEGPPQNADTTPPPVPSIAPTNGSKISGTTEAGAKVDLDPDGNGSTDATVTADGSGNWSYTPATPIPNGTTVTAKATDAAGNSSGPASVVVDAATPAPAITSVTDDMGAVTGAVASGGVTDDKQPAIAGSGAEANATVSVYDGEALLGTTKADGSGNWSFTPTTPLGEGAHSFTAKASDSLGNTSSASNAYAITVDTTAPPAPVINPTDGSPVTGTAEPGTTVGLDIDGNGSTDAMVPVDGSGNWSYTPATPVPDGATITAKATDAAGNTSGPATRVVDAASPTPVITSVTDDIGSETGLVTKGGTTDDNRPAIAGSGAEANATVSVFDGATLLGTTKANDSGSWSFTPSAPLADGTHGFTAKATDSLGNTSGASAAYTITVDDDAPPPAPVITSIADDVGTVKGTVANGGVTDDKQPAIAGSGAEANAIVSIYDGEALLGTTKADGSGSWSFTPTTPLDEGPYSFTATVTDGNGDTSAASSAYGITVDTTAPAAPVINLTDGSAVTGAAEPGANVSLDVDGNGSTDATVPVDGSGNWSYTPASPIPDGTTITARATDAAGNTSGPASTVVDSDALPPAPVITSVADDVGPVTGIVGKGGATNDKQPAIIGSGAEASATVSVFDGATLLGTTKADGSGNWSFTPATELKDGAHNFIATVTDSDGDTSVGSAIYGITVDTAVPGAPVIDPTDGSTVTGTAEPGTQVGLDIDGNGSTDATVPVDGSGNWSYTPETPIPDGTTITARATDAAGNTSGPATTEVDATTPTPVITSVTDDAGAVQGVVADGGTTDDARPAIAGSGAEASATVSVYDGATLLGTTKADGSGGWSFTPTSPLDEGEHDFTVTATDELGNTSPASEAYTVTVEAPTGPVAAIEITALADDTGPDGDWITEDRSPTISGTLSQALEADERVEIRLDGSGTWTTATVDGTSWFYGSDTLATGSHTIEVRVIDAADNVGDTDSQAITLTDVNQAPSVLARDNDLLGLVSAEALGLIDLNQQSLTAFDIDGNLEAVEVRYAPLLNLNLGAYTLTASADLAAELGLSINIVNNPGLLGILAPSSVLTISAGGGTIDNLAINELLATVHFEQDLTLLGAQVLTSTSIEATDSEGLSDNDTTGSLADLSLLNVNGDANVIEGTSNGEPLTGTGASERLYGYGGSDTLSGGGGNDLLRGGAGSDSLDGGTGNDVLVYDAADSLIDGGGGFDILLVDNSSGSAITLDGATTVQNVERIDLRAGDSGRSLTLTEAGITQASANQELTVTGDGNDSVTLTGASFEGQVLVNNHAYDQYALGAATVFVEASMVVIA